MPNLHAIGETLSNAMRPHASAHSISMRRTREGVPDILVGPFSASSPPIGQQLLTETGMNITDQERSFNFEANLIIGWLGFPQVGDVIIDHADQSEWRVLPLGSDFAWRWQGQMRTAFHVKAKQDGPGVCEI